LVRIMIYSLNRTCTMNGLPPVNGQT
jgi:hypothetical protein